MVIVDCQGKPKYSEKTSPSAALSTTNPTWPGLGSNPDRRSRKPASNHLSYGTAQATSYVLSYFPTEITLQYIILDVILFSLF
jgi:hypothetical protein